MSFSMPFSIGQIVVGLILVALGAIVATEASRNNLLTPASSPTPTQNTTTPASTPIPTVNLIFKTSPTPAAAKNTTSSDPIVNCPFQHTGTLRVTQSKCNAMTDCEVSPGKWQAVFKTDCDALLKNQVKEKTTTEAVVPAAAEEYVPVFVNGGTYSCQKSSVDAIKESGKSVEQQRSKDSQCRKDEVVKQNTCSDSCQASFDTDIAFCKLYAPDGYSACLDEAVAKSASCGESCYERYGWQVCDRYSSTNDFYDEFEKLIKKYCKL